ncbi:MAG: serine/threonine-protein kinase [Gemmatimonadetes bacterium]|nr:serine/threonine-protein kinase [Gemmatimonadota bacterium]
MPDPRARLAAALADRYRLERELGAGGMATVYLAEDLKHHRKVAIKVLKEDLGASVGAARFLREIEIDAQLQHPHILPLLDSGEADGLLYYVMPFVEGQSLRDKLARERELPVGDAVRILVEVVDALAYAHKRGVVHRDIKPDNVMLSGRHALVTDFGVAKAVSDAAGHDAITTVGVALGTPTYMAPEQAVADPQVDHRADIYAVGVLAYELLAGRAPFTGTNAQQVLVAQISQPPEPLSKHRPGLPATLEQAVMRCLEKRAADRFQSADELLAVLESLATPSGGTAPSTAQLPREARRVQPAVYLAGAAVVALAAFGIWRVTHPALKPFEFGRSTRFTTDPGLEVAPEISPDGKFVAFASGTARRMRIFIRPVGGGRTLALSDDTTAYEFAPRWAPDGSRLLFLTRGGVSVAPALGGSSVAVIARTGAAAVNSAAWSPDGSEIAFTRGDTLYRVAASGGTPTRLGTGLDLHSCSWSPAGEWIACVQSNSVGVTPSFSFGNIAPSEVLLFPASGGERITLIESTSSNLSPAWSQDGRRLYFLSSRDGPRDLYAQELSSAGAARGAPVRLTTGLGALFYSLSADGSTLAYAVYSARSNIWSLPIPTGGAPAVALPRTATQLTQGTQVIEAMSVSPDGRWLLYDSDLKGNADIWRIPIAGGSAEQLTFEPYEEFAPELSPDGRSVAYHSWRTGSRDIEVKPLDGGRVEFVTATPGQESYPRWSPDGAAIAFVDQTGAGSGNGMLTRREASGAWSTPTRLAVNWPRWSPDGSWIGGISHTPEGVSRLTVQPMGGGPPRVLREWPATEPAPITGVAVSADGRTLFTKEHDRNGMTSFVAYPVAGGAPRLLVRFPDPTWQSARDDFAVDARRFYFPVEERESDVFVAEIRRR